MSRIYNNQPLQNLPLIAIDYRGVWEYDKAKPREQKGGFLLEGIIQGRSHFVVTDHSNNKAHYYIFYLTVQHAHKRKFTDTGKEIEPNFSETKKVSTGYLNSSYKVEAKGMTDRLSPDEAVANLDIPDLVQFTSSHSPDGCASLWMKADKCEQMELENGDSVRVKTDGDGPFILSIAKLDVKTSTVSNYAGGDAVGSTWTDKIMDIKASGSSKGMQEMEGVDEDEWDD